MSFDKYMGKEHRKPYHGAKAVDSQCRNHGSCTYCQSNRTHNDNKRRLANRSSYDDYFEEVPTCEDCRFNKGIDMWNRPDRVIGPCGQQNCWYEL